MSELFWHAFSIMHWRSAGALLPSSNFSTMPPVTSVRASLIRPPLSASYEPLSLHRRTEQHRYMCTRDTHRDTNNDTYLMDSFYDKKKHPGTLDSVSMVY